MSAASSAGIGVGCYGNQRNRAWKEGKTSLTFNVHGEEQESKDALLDQWALACVFNKSYKKTALKGKTLNNQSYGGAALIFSLNLLLLFLNVLHSEYLCHWIRKNLKHHLKFILLILHWWINILDVDDWVFEFFSTGQVSVELHRLCTKAR